MTEETSTNTGLCPHGVRYEVCQRCAPRQSTAEIIVDLRAEVRRLKDEVILHVSGAKTARDQNGDQRDTIYSLWQLADELAEMARRTKRNYSTCGCAYYQDGGTCMRCVAIAALTSYAKMKSPCKDADIGTLAAAKATGRLAYDKAKEGHGDETG